MFFAGPQLSGVDRLAHHSCNAVDELLAALLALCQGCLQIGAALGFEQVDLHHLSQFRIALHCFQQLYEDPV